MGRDNGDGTYDVMFDDGDRDRKVPKRSIKSSSPKRGSRGRDETDSEETSNFREGDKVEAKYKGRSRYYPGVISRCRLNGNYDIDYDDGEQEKNVKPELIRGKGGKMARSKSPKKSKIQEGDKVMAQCKGSRAHYPGKIRFDNGDGTYGVAFGDRDRAVPESSIKPKSPQRGSRGFDDSTDDSESQGFNRGDKVMAQCKGSRQFYPGKIRSDNGDDTFDVMFDDGDRDRRVPLRGIKSAEKSPRRHGRDDDSSDAEPQLKKGDKVEAKCKGSRQHYPEKYGEIMVMART